MSYIPPEISREILIRVPAEPLLRVRAVCKEWRRLIDDKSFIETHSRIQHPPTTLLIKNSRGGRIYSLSLDSLNLENGSQNMEAIPVKTLVPGGVPPVPHLPVPSCNGLILIIYKHFDTNKTWVIWNRLTREFHKLPKPSRDLYVLASGLGYDSATHDYKVVIIAGDHYWDVSWRTFVYSLKFDSWNMSDDNFPVNSWCEGRGVFLDGSLYWKLENIIIAFDIGTENYSQLPLPRVTKEPGKLIDTYLDAIGGCLVLSCYYKEYYCYEDRLDGWVMKDCKVEKSWTKLFSFRNEDRVCRRVTFRAIAYLKSKGQILLQHDNRLFWLDIEKNSAREVTVHGLPDIFSSQICRGSLFRLDQSYNVSRGVANKRKGLQKKEYSLESDLYGLDSSFLSLDEDCI